MRYRRWVLLTLAVAVVALVGYSAWQAYQLQRELTRAEASVDAVRVALQNDDASARDLAISDLQAAAAEARDRTDGAWWAAAQRVPLFGDDVEGLRVLSRTLAVVSSDGVGPLAASVDELDRLNVGDRIDVELVESLQEPVARASQVFDSASDEVGALDSEGYLGVFRSRFDDYADQLREAATSLRSADTAVQVLPAMVGGDERRRYLLIFQNNAEIRATGGLPGSWALVNAEDGRLELNRQGTATDFPVQDRPVLPLTEAEQAVYGDAYGQFFQNPGFAPDFPRAAELWTAHWDLRYPDAPLDGVLAIDPVALSYLLEGTGPITVNGRTLTGGNAVDELLSRPYRELDTTAQDEFFGQVARAVFDAATGQLASPVAFVEGFGRAAREGRFLVSSESSADTAALEGSRVLGELSGDDGRTPHVDIGVNDATGSKMSYYLRYAIDVQAESCEDDRQQLAGRMTLNQSISPAEAAKLPTSVTGGGQFGTEAGSQTVLLRIYGPYDGVISDVAIDGERAEPTDYDNSIDGRPVVTVVTQLTSRADVMVTWRMASGEGQVADGEVDATSGVVPGSRRSRFSSAC